jgi:serine/threonine protein kinase
MLTWQKYNVEVDMWSAGCILAEMIEGSPLFPGRNHTDQFLVIADLLGSIPSDVIQAICSKSVSGIISMEVVIYRLTLTQTSEYITGLPERAKVPFANKIKQAFPDGMSQAERYLRKTCSIYHSSRLIGTATGVESGATNNSRSCFISPISESVPRSNRRAYSKSNI